MQSYNPFMSILLLNISQLTLFNESGTIFSFFFNEMHYEMCLYFKFPADKRRSPSATSTRQNYHEGIIFSYNTISSTTNLNRSHHRIFAASSACPFACSAARNFVAEFTPYFFGLPIPLHGISSLCSSTSDFRLPTSNFQLPTSNLQPPTF